jgi:hypothetical protein
VTAGYDILVLLNGMFGSGYAKLGSSLC